MSMLTFIGLLILGLIAGYFSGLVGVGGGIIIVPTLVLLFGFTQHTAQGTTLALLIPPIGIFAAWEYYQKGFVDVKTAAIICAGFIIGGYFGGLTAVNIPQEILKKVFASVLIGVGIKMLLS